MKELSPPTIEISSGTISCLCGEYSYVIKGMSETPSNIKSSIFVLYLDGEAKAVAVYDPNKIMATWLYPSVSNGEIVANADLKKAVFTIPAALEYKVAHCEILVFERPTTHLARTASAKR